MSTYRLLIFISNDSIHVLEALNNDTLKHIGFQGNEYYTYADVSDIDTFFEELKDHYNVDELSELNIHINIFDRNASKQ